MALTVVLASNADEVQRWGLIADHEAHIISPPGCEIEYAAEDEPAKVAAVQSTANVRSAARNFSTSTINLQETFTQRGEVIRETTREFTMPQSGINMRVHGPEGMEIDEELFDELFHASLTLDEEYGDPEVRQLIDCYREEIIENRALEGTEYNVYIKNELGYCIEGLRYQVAEEVKERGEKCDGNGATPPKFEFEMIGIEVFGWYPMFLSTSKTEVEAANASISRIFMHESIHAHMALMRQPFRLDPDEKLAKYIETAVRENLYPDGVPLAIKYPESTP